MPAPFTDEDRARLRDLADTYAIQHGDDQLLVRALAYIDHLEGALREIANHPGTKWCDGNCAERMVELARAALSTKEEA